jgi:hypothetical protein
MVGYNGTSLIVSGPFGAAWQDTLNKVLPIFEDVSKQFTDPSKRVAVLTAQLDKAVFEGASPYKIQELQGRLTAAEKDLASHEELEQSKREISTLTKIGFVVGIGLLGSIIFFVLTKALKT